MQVMRTFQELQMKDMEFQRRRDPRGFGEEETFALNLEGMAELALMKKVNKGIPERGKIQVQKECGKARK